MAVAPIELPTGLWRNGSASDSRSEGWEFESLWPHPFIARVAYKIPQASSLSRLKFGTRLPCKASVDSCEFARVVKGVDLRSTAGNCAWARTPQLTGIRVRTCRR